MFSQFKFVCSHIVFLVSQETMTRIKGIQFYTVSIIEYRGIIKVLIKIIPGLFLIFGY